MVPSEAGRGSWPFSLQYRANFDHWLVLDLSVVGAKPCLASLTIATPEAVSGTIEAVCRWSARAAVSRLRREEVRMLDSRAGREELNNFSG